MKGTRNRRQKGEVERIIERFKKAGVRIRSYTVYPGKGTFRACVTIERKEAVRSNEASGRKGLR